MAKLKNYNVVLLHFVLFLTFIGCLSCTQQKWYVAQIDGKEIEVTDQTKEAEAINVYIKPYKAAIDKDLNTVLAYASENIDKNGEWQTSIGNLFADVALQKGNPIFLARENKAIDFVMLNSGGIRSIIPQGNVTARTAYEIMPFENTLVVLELKSEQIKELIQHIITEKKPHPLSGLTFTIDKNNSAKSIQIQGKPFKENFIYYVGTNDYLSKGGDNMIFFKKALNTYDLDYKLRNILIDYFNETDTIPKIMDIRIKSEK